MRFSASAVLRLSDLLCRMDKSCIALWDALKMLTLLVQPVVKQQSQSMLMLDSAL